MCLVIVAAAIVLLDCSQKVVFIEPFVHDSHVLQLSACIALSTLQLWGKPFDTRKGINSNILGESESNTKLFPNIDEIMRFDKNKDDLDLQQIPSSSLIVSCNQ